MVTIRRAIPEDAPTVARVHDSSLGSQGTDHYTEEHLAAMAPPERDLDALGADVLDRDDRYVAVAEGEDGVVDPVGEDHSLEEVLERASVEELRAVLLAVAGDDVHLRRRLYEELGSG